MCKSLNSDPKTLQDISGLLDSKYYKSSTRCIQKQVCHFNT